MKVRVKLRHNNDNNTNEHSSLFIRLPNHILQKLCHNNDTYCSNNNINHPNEFFLPLELTYNMYLDTATAKSVKKVVYGSFNGGILLGVNDDDDVIEVPKSLFYYHMNNNIQLDMNIDCDDYIENVHIRCLSSVMDATGDIGIQLNPVSVKDWEMLEVHAEALENGVLLSQVSVVFPGQILPLSLSWGPAQQRQRSKLTSVSDYKQEKLVAVVQVQPFMVIDGQKQEEQYQCLRLVQDTEVSVKPFPRVPNHDASYEPSFPLRLIPTAHDFSDDMINIANDAYSCMKMFCWKEFQVKCVDSSFRRCQTNIDVPPYSVIIHPSTMKRMVKDYSPSVNYTAKIYKGVGDDDDNDGKHLTRALLKCNAIVGCIVCSDDILPGCAALHAIFQLQLDVQPLRNDIVIQVLNKRQSVCAQSICLDSRFFQITPIITHKQLQPNVMNHEEALEHSKSLPSTFFRQIDDAQNISPPCGNPQHVLALIEAWLKALPMVSTPISFPAIVSFPIQNTCGNLSMWCISLSSNENDIIASPKTTEVPQFMFARNLLHHLKTRASYKITKHSLRLDENFSYFRLSPEYISSLGIKHQLGFFMHYIFHYLSMSDVRPNIPGIIVSGEEGIGKTHFLLTAAVASRVLLGVSTICIDCKKIQAKSTSLKEILDKLTDIFQSAYNQSPSLVLLDNLDSLAFEVDDDEVNNPNSNLSDQAKVIADHILSIFAEFGFSNEHNDTTAKVILICSGRHYSRIHRSLRIPYRLDLGVELNPPDLYLRIELFLCMTKSFGMRGCLEQALEGISFGRRTEGFRQADIFILALRCVNIARLRKFGRISSGDSDSKTTPLITLFTLATPLIISVDDIELALSIYTPISLRKSGSTKGKVKWEDVGGLRQAKQQLIDYVVKPTIFKKVYQHAPMRLPRGMLLYGPSGCGKTVLVSALAHTAGLNMITCKGPEILDKYIGASEAAVRDLFQRAYNASPALLFFDEFEALAPKRGSDNTGVTDRVVNQLLTFMDGVETGKGTLYILAATTRPDMIDSALLRPGRLDKHIYVGLPESLEEIKEILEVFCDGRPLSGKAREIIENNSLVERARDSKKLSAVDLKAVIDEAYLRAIHVNISNDKGSEDIEISEEQLRESFASCRQSISAWDAEFYRKVYSNFKHQPKKSSHNKDTADVFGTNTMNNAIMNHGRRTSLR